jgi:hypothetical protein
MASVAELASGVRAALQQVATARTALVRLVTPIEEAGHTYTQIGQGSSRPELDNAAACLRTAYGQCREIVTILDQVTALATAYLTSIIGAPWQLAGEEVENLRRELPPPITAAERGTGRKTHGRWVGEDGISRKIVSGQDAVSSLATDRLRRLGIRRTPSVATHAEMKLAAILARRHEATGRPQHASIVINHKPCFGELGCPTLLPWMLPEGCSLTVYAPHYRRTFTGGATNDPA